MRVQKQRRPWLGRTDFFRTELLPGPSLETAGKEKWDSGTWAAEAGLTLWRVAWYSDSGSDRLGH